MANGHMLIVALAALTMVAAVALMAGCTRGDASSVPDGPTDNPGGAVDGPVTGDRIDTSNPNAPHYIESDELETFEATFDVDGTRYSYRLERAGTWLLTWDDVTLEVGPEVAADINGLIKDTDVLYLNGTHVEVAGLPFGVGEYAVRATWASGETFSADENCAAPYFWQEFSGWLRRYVDALFAAAGDPRALANLKAASQPVVSFSLTWGGGDTAGYSYHFFYDDESEEGLCYVEAWDAMEGLEAMGEARVSDVADALTNVAAEQGVWYYPAAQDHTPDPYMLDGSNYYTLTIEYADGTVVEKEGCFTVEEVHAQLAALVGSIEIIED